MKKTILCGLSLALASTAWAKLPPPSDEAKAKAAEAAAKTAWVAKVDAYALCKSQDRVAAAYAKAAKAEHKETKLATATPPCADPGPFVYPTPVAAAVTAPAATAASAAVASALKKKP